MKQEILANGPITSKMLVFDDLATEYQSGVYSYEFDTSNDLIGSHAVLIVGWGHIQDQEDQTVKYWIVKNSWGQDWGE